jgi:hypothetical protein
MSIVPYDYDYDGGVLYKTPEYKTAISPQAAANRLRGLEKRTIATLMRKFGITEQQARDFMAEQASEASVQPPSGWRLPTGKEWPNVVFRQTKATKAESQKPSEALEAEMAQALATIANAQNAIAAARKRVTSIKGILKRRNRVGAVAPQAGPGMGFGGFSMY